MPISTNAPFNEFGQSQILRDIEQLYLALNGAGSGGPGDGQTQDQSEATSQDSGGLPDLSGLATIVYVDESIAAIPGVTYPISIANGGTGQITQQAAINALAGGVTNNRVMRGNGTNVVLAQVALGTDVSGTLPIANGGTGQTTVNAALTALGGSFANYASLSAGSYSIPANVYRAMFVCIGGGGGGAGSPSDSTIGYIAAFSGGAVTQALTMKVTGGGGGGGAFAAAIVNVVPAESWSVSIGTGGAGGSSAGTDGGVTQVSKASVLSLTAGGGSGGGRYSTGGCRGGIPDCVISDATRCIAPFLAFGAPGESGVFDISGLTPDAGSGGSGIRAADNVYGAGGDGASSGGSSGSAGSNGRAYIFY